MESSSIGEHLELGEVCSQTNFLNPTSGSLSDNNRGLSKVFERSFGLVKHFL